MDMHVSEINSKILPRLTILKEKRESAMDNYQYDCRHIANLDMQVDYINNGFLDAVLISKKDYEDYILMYETLFHYTKHKLPFDCIVHIARYL